MTTRRLLPVLVLAIAGLAGLGCGNQQQVPSNLTQSSNPGAKNIDPEVGNDAAAVPDGSQRRATQFTLSDPRQNVLSSGFPTYEW